MKNLGYSQNFLVNKKLVERLISKSNIDVTDYVIEIGPGKGIITDVLSQHAGEVVAVEYDQELYNNLVRYHSHDNVTYIFGDFLKYKLPLNRRYKIFSNIPFQITADIIRKLTDDVNPPSDINIIIQREAAKKNCGIPLQKYEGFRAAIIKAQYKVEITHSFKRSDFFPSPNVDTVMLHMQLWDDRLSGDDLQNYKDLVAFFYTNIKGETAKERLSILFSNEQIKRLGKANRISLSNSYTLITAEQWMNIYYYSKIGLTDEKKKSFKMHIKNFKKWIKNWKSKTEHLYESLVAIRNVEKGLILLMVQKIDSIDNFYKNVHGSAKIWEENLMLDFVDSRFQWVNHKSILESKNNRGSRIYLLDTRRRDWI